MSSLMNLGILASFLASVTWAIGVSGYTALSKRYPPAAINFSRALVALPVFVLLTLITQGLTGYEPVTSHHLSWLTLSMISSYALGDVLLLMSIARIGLPAALAIASTYPIWSAAADLLFRGVAIGASQIAGLFIVVFGTILVILGGHAESTRRDIRGYLLALATSLFWALNVVSVAEGGRGLAPTATNTLRMALALILCPPIGYLLNKSTKVLISKQDFKNMSWIFLLEGVGGASVFIYGMTHAPLAIASALSSLAPVLTVPIAAAMGWERPTMKRSSGLVLVVLGVWLLL